VTRPRPFDGTDAPGSARGAVAHLPFYALLAAYFAYLAVRASGLPLVEWDESRNVLNAHEMLRSGDWIALRFDGALDHYNLKPPLFPWILAAAFRTFGYSELAARLPSILFGLATAALVYHFVVHVTRDRFAAAAAGLGLVTATGFHGFHAILSADVDVALAAFTTLAFVAAWFAFLEERPAWLLVLGAALGLGFMTKSLVGLLPLGTAAIAFLMRPVRKNLLDRRLAAGGALALALVLPWLLARDLLYPDHYLRLMIGHDILDRGLTVLEEHSGGAFYYLDRAMGHLGWWVFAALLAAAAVAIAALRQRGGARAALLREPAFQAAALGVATVAFHYAAFSLAASKLPWYLLPAYPPLFMVVGIGFASFMDFLAPTLRRGLLAIPLVGSLFAMAAYDARFASGVPEVDHLLFPFREEIRHRGLITRGALRQNTLALSHLYSDSRTWGFPEGTPLEAMLAAAPGAEFLLATDADALEGRPRLAALRMVRVQGRPHGPGLFRILPP